MLWLSALKVEEGSLSQGAPVLLEAGKGKGGGFSPGASLGASPADTLAVAH